MSTATWRGDLKAVFVSKRNEEVGLQQQKGLGEVGRVVWVSRELTELKYVKISDCICIVFKPQEPS